MLHTIQNDSLVCKIESVGAEIRSLIDKNTGVEYIWQIDESVWGSSSPVLFPAIGKIKSGQIEFKGKSFNMPKHGIIRNNDQLKFEKLNSSKCCFILESSETTLKQYPFQFLFKVQYELIENRLLMSYIIENKGQVELFFNCGGHTAYACPLDKETNLPDYVIEFPNSIALKAATLGDSGLLSDKIREIPTVNNYLQLSETIFNDDALIFENLNMDWVRLKRKDASKGIIVKFKEYPNLALWSKPGADYVCIEPWLGLPDRENESVNITKKSTFKKLQPDERYSIAIETVIE
jgi:galactose mutarotase-like enzyme